MKPADLDDSGDVVRVTEDLLSACPVDCHVLVVGVSTSGDRAADGTRATQKCRAIYTAWSGTGETGISIRLSVL